MPVGHEHKEQNPTTNNTGTLTEQKLPGTKFSSRRRRRFHISPNLTTDSAALTATTNNNTNTNTSDPLSPLSITSDSSSSSSSPRSDAASPKDESLSSSEDTESISYPETRTVIIFDWDDTLLCSTYLSNQGIRLDTPLDKNHALNAKLKQLETSVVSVLSEAIQYGDVHIITNAESCWVELSAKKFIPAVLPLLAEVRVTSARSTYEKSYPNSPLKWKYHAFQTRLSPIFVEPKDFKNIICFGDSTIEREAVRAVTKGVPNTILKNVKFAERPSIDQLQKQLEMLEKNMNYICHHQNELDLMLTIACKS